MRLRNRVALILLMAVPALAGRVGEQAGAPAGFFYTVSGESQGSWPSILEAVGLMPSVDGDASVIVVRGGEAEQFRLWSAQIERGAFLILEGASPLAAKFGFQPGEKRAAVRNVLEHRAPKLEIVWQEQLELPIFELPPDARVFAEDRWSGAPLLAGYRQGLGGVLWVATDPGLKGHERYPYIVHALADLGWDPPFRSRRLWAFFDSSYRSRVDLGYFARRWRDSGISALHVAAWHYFEPDEKRDEYLERLISECHRNAIQVYAWLELPHVSEKFWTDHPEWREQTAILQDAHLDWRKLMNLTDPDCARAVKAGTLDLINRFDWDGVNLAELYFESLEGVENPARFTPMNATVRAEFAGLHGFDPIELFSADSETVKQRAFLDYRAELARRLQEEWMRTIGQARQRKPYLDLTLTHVDDRVDTRMRDLIGADSSRTLPLLDRHDFTFLVEDPATVWDRGPERYTEIAEHYLPVTPRPEKLAIDINIVERYQDVYPTKQQSGTELLRQLHLAARAFPRVAVYAEHSMLSHDLALVPSSSAGVESIERRGAKLVIESPHGAGVSWRGPASIDGRLWPVADDETVWAPKGRHVIEPAAEMAALRLLDFNGEIDQAVAVSGGLDFVYRSATRAYARLERNPGTLEVDGVAAEPNLVEDRGSWVLTLPRGQHLVSIRLP